MNFETNKMMFERHLRRMIDNDDDDDDCLDNEPTKDVPAYIVFLQRRRFLFTGF